MKILWWSLVSLGLAGIVFAGGVLVGRQYPAHRFERMGESWYVFDSTTGKACSPFKDPNAPTNLIDQGMAGNQDPFAKYGGHETDTNGLPLEKVYPPPCGK